MAAHDGAIVIRAVIELAASGRRARAGLRRLRSRSRPSAPSMRQFARTKIAAAAAVDHERELNGRFRRRERGGHGAPRRRMSDRTIDGHVGMESKDAYTSIKIACVEHGSKE